MKAKVKINGVETEVEFTHYRSEELYQTEPPIPGMGYPKRINTYKDLIKIGTGTLEVDRVEIIGGTYTVKFIYSDQEFKTITELIEYHLNTVQNASAS